jgi:hypothetical protein
VSTYFFRFLFLLPRVGERDDVEYVGEHRCRVIRDSSITKWESRIGKISKWFADVVTVCMYSRSGELAHAALQYVVVAMLPPAADTAVLVHLPLGFPFSDTGCSSSVLGECSRTRIKLNSTWQ